MCFLICIITFIITVIISNVDFVSFSGGIWDLYFVSVSTVGRCVHYRVIILLGFFSISLLNVLVCLIQCFWLCWCCFVSVVYQTE